MIKNNLEIETKYNAAEIPLTEFKKFCEEREPERYIQASGFDYFYSSPDDPASFCRHRTGADKNEFTYKKKTSDSNNTIRREVNVQMEKGEPIATGAALAESFGYKYNTSIFKTCFVYTYSWYTLVYYICYDSEMKELGRYLEIEMKEDYGWKSEEEAWNQLIIIEKLCKPLGVTPQARIKRSLFELYRKESA